jgi:hypothetical protein
MGKKSQNRAHDDADLPPLSAKEIAELKRRVADLEDPTRYVIVSAFSRRFCLYYCPESGNYIMNEIPPEAMFKRKAEAVAVAKVLDRGRPSRTRKRVPKSLQVIAVKKTKRGVRILEEVSDPWNKGQRWKPSLRRRDRGEADKA